MRLFAVCAVVLALAVTGPASAGQKLPVVAGTVLHCDQQNNDTPTHHGNLAFAWDFNLSGASGSADLGLPVTAVEDGIVVYAQDYAAGMDDWGKCVVVQFSNGQFGMTAHMQQMFVKKYERVKQGQALGTLGDADGRYANAAHIHYQRQSGSTPNAASVSSSFDDAGVPTLGTNNTSQNTGRFDSEFSTNGGSGAFGTLQNPTGTYAGVHWHYTLNLGSAYRANNLANNCYVQNWAGSTYATCGIVYDALGGARRAYTVRNGFYHDGNNQGWNDIGGPNSALGMPLTNEYSYLGGSRQDFQSGYLRYQQGHTPTEVWSTSYTAPGWTSSGWNNQFSYLMAMAYDRNGRSPTVGSASGSATSYTFTAPNGSSSYYRQGFSGGTNGSGAIFYHPDNAVKNAQATNEAYYLYGEFWTKWNDLGGANTCGVPTRDWYMSRDPENWGNPTEYKLQNFMRANGEQHYMLLRNGVVEWHSSYNSDWVTQNPFTIDLNPGGTATFSVTYKNLGSTTWLGSGTPSSNPDYIELRSCSPWPDGDVQNSWVYPGSGWISSSRVCTASQASIAPGQNATFTFTVKVPDNQPAGNDQRAYFRPWHATGGLIEEWDGYYVQINVVAPSPPAGSLKPLAGDFDGGGKADVCLFAPATGQWFVATSTGTSFVPASTIWLQNWGTNAGGYQPFTGDFNGDGKTDVGVYDPASGGWFVATSNGSSFVPAPTAWLGNWGIDPTFKALAGDFTGDGKTDVGLYHPASGGWFVAVSTGSSFTPSAYAWLGPWGTNATAYRPIVGWFNSGATCDVGLYEPAYGQWFVATSNGSSSFTPSPSGWLGDWGASTTLQNLTADFNGGGLSDVCVYDPASGGWSVATSGGSSFTGSPSAWLYPWGADVTFKALAADFTGDGKADVALYHPSSGGWFEATSTGSAFTPSAYAWLGSWGAGGSSLQYAPPGDDQPQPAAPIAFRLWMATNPTHRDGQILFTLPSPERVRIAVYDVRGREVGVVTERDYSAGQHTLSLTEAAKSGLLPNGVYFVRLTSALRTATAKLALIN